MTKYLCHQQRSSLIQRHVNKGKKWKNSRIHTTKDPSWNGIKRRQRTPEWWQWSMQILLDTFPNSGALDERCNQIDEREMRSSWWRQHHYLYMFWMGVGVVVHARKGDCDWLNWYSGQLATTSITDNYPHTIKKKNATLWPCRWYTRTRAIVKVAS